MPPVDYLAKNRKTYTASEIAPFKAKSPSLGILPAHTGKAIYKAAENGDILVIDINKAEKNGCTPLYFASYSGHIGWGVLLA